MVKIAVGIDLGTTYSCIAAYVNNKFEVLADYNGNKTIPSFVAFLDDSGSAVEVGHVAKENFLIEAASRVYGKHFKLVNPG
jgi:heat shock protein 1/8